MVNILYNFSLGVFALFALPNMVYAMLRFGKYRKSFKKRLGLGFPKISKGDQKLIWIHAVSMGETKAVYPLAKKLREDLPNAIFLISSATETGYAEAKKTFTFANFHVFLPFDFSWIIKPILKRVRPDLVIISENDLWLQFLSAAKKNGAKIAIVNGKISERSLKRFLFFPFFTKRLFSQIDLFCMQSDRYKERLLKLRIPKEKIVVSGNLKLDADLKQHSVEELQTLKDRFKIDDDTPVIVAGSTHFGEESLIVKTFLMLLPKFPKAKLFLVPRHPERFNEVATLLKNFQIPYLRWSAFEEVSGKEKIILIDAMGVLLSCYQIADLTIVGGSFNSKVGGHNIVEPSWYSKPVIFGPHMHSQPDLVDLIHEFKAGLQVSEDTLLEAVTSLLESKAKASQIGLQGLNLVKAMRGSNQKTLETLKNHLLKKELLH